MDQKYIWGLIILALLFLHPLSRSLILWVLPLGWRADDLLFMGALLCFLIPWLWGWPRIPHFVRKYRKEHLDNE